MSDENTLDPRNLTFSQAYGYKDIPQPLRLEEITMGSRAKLWGSLYHFLELSSRGWGFVRGDWREILASLHVDHYEYNLDELDYSLVKITYKYKQHFMNDKFHELFDLLLAIMRHPKCPHEFILKIEAVFRESRLAYIVDISNPATICPAPTKEEGEAVLHSIDELNNAGLAGPVKHLRLASDCINHGDHAGAVRECIHAVESTARQFDPTARTLGPTLKSLGKEWGLHPALTEAFSKLYGFASDEPGIRHALKDRQQPNVGQDEAIFMFGACAAFSSYLTRKHRDRTS